MYEPHAQPGEGKAAVAAAAAAAVVADDQKAKLDTYNKVFTPRGPVMAGLYGVAVFWVVYLCSHAILPFDTAATATADDGDHKVKVVLTLILHFLLALFGAGVSKAVRDGMWNEAVEARRHLQITGNIWDMMPHLSAVVLASTAWYLRSQLVYHAALPQFLCTIVLTLFLSLLTRNREDAKKLA
jgi:hypothetical protein